MLLILLSIADVSHSTCTDIHIHRYIAIEFYICIFVWTILWLYYSYITISIHIFLVSFLRFDSLFVSLTLKDARIEPGRG